MKGHEGQAMARAPIEPEKEPAVSLPPQHELPVSEAQLRLAEYYKTPEGREEFAAECLVRFPGIIGRYLTRPDELNDIDDVVDESIIHALAGLDKFEGRSQLLTYSTRIAINDALEYLRKKKRGVANKTAINSIDELEEVGALVKSPDPDPERLVMYTDLREQLAQALKILPTEQQEIIRLRYVDGCSTKEISQKMGKTEENVKTILFRSKKRLSETAKIKKLSGYA